MAYKAKQKQEVLRKWTQLQQTKSPPSLREFSKAEGVSAPTLTRWFQESRRAAAQGTGPDLDLPSIEQQEREVRQLLISQARAVLSDIELADPKGQQEKANAASKLLEKYQLLSGQPDSRKETVHSSGWMEEEMDAFFDELGLNEAGEEVPPFEEDMEQGP